MYVFLAEKPILTLLILSNISNYKTETFLQYVRLHKSLFHQNVIVFAMISNFGLQLCYLPYCHIVTSTVFVSL